MHWIFKVIFLLLIFSLFSFYLVIRPFKINSDITPKTYGMDFQEINFKTKDGITLNGWFVPAKKTTKKVIILLHGYPADKGNIFPAMRFLQKKYNLFLFDFRYFGKSDGLYTTIGKEEILDLMAAIDYLKKQGMQEIGVWGLSMGGAVALMTAVQTSDIKMVVADSAYARLDWMAQSHFRIPIIRNVFAMLIRFWGYILLHSDINAVNPAEAVAKLKIPVLLIYSRGDDLVSSRHGDLLKDKASLNPNAKVIVNDDLKHGELPVNYQQTILEFFKSL